ncbi:MAG: hypothetical protein BMS9Abin13_621 [Patescibacteria group bacterium]|nr:MAG: hypothetical protein BMS9Abin13_621 [Patescibacteria group bacterium]
MDIMDTEQTHEEKRANARLNLNSVSLLILLFIAFLIPLFFLPIFNISTNVSKGVLLSTVVTIVFFLWLIARLKDGRFVLPKSLVLGALGVVSIVFLISSIFSEAPAVSLVGLGFEIGTFSSILIFSLLTFLSAIFFQSKKSIFSLYGVLFLSALVVFLFQVLRFVFLSFGLPLSGVFSNLPLNLVGKWTDLAVFFGLTLVLSLVTLDLVELNKKTRRILYGILVISLLMLAAVNFALSWFIVGIFSLIIFVYALSFGKGGGGNTPSERKIPIASFSVLLVSLFFILASGLVSGFIFSLLNISPETLHPSWTQTFEVAKGALTENPVLGSGPNRFASQWLLFKPEGINNSTIWNIDFSAGAGLIPSFVVTTGALGLLAWLLFFAVFLYRGFMSVFSVRLVPIQHYILLSSFLSATYLWAFTVLYVPNIAIITLAFLMTGVFVAALAEGKLIKNYNFSFLEDPRVSFVSVLVLILLIMSSAAGGYFLFQKFFSVGYFQRSIVAFNVEGNLDKAERSMISALRLDRNDLYYRNFADMNIARLREVMSRSGVSEETTKAQFRSIAEIAVQNALLAVEEDNTNYLNFVSLARVYEFLIPFGASEELYENAKQSYEKALSLNPRSPALRLSQARLEVARGDSAEAKNYIAQALNDKNNYTEAIFLLSQIQADEGDLDEAIVSATYASSISPNDIGVFFQLGYLKYQDKDYRGAIFALGRAIELNPNFANAKYFLGLSYAKMGDRDKAIRQFEDILILNPGHEGVRQILKNLRAGRSALAGASPKVLVPKDIDSLSIEEE